MGYFLTSHPKLTWRSPGSMHSSVTIYSWAQNCCHRFGMFDKSCYPVSSKVRHVVRFRRIPEQICFSFFIPDWVVEMRPTAQCLKVKCARTLVLKHHRRSVWKYFISGFVWVVLITTLIQVNNTLLVPVMAWTWNWLAFHILMRFPLTLPWLKMANHRL